MTLVTAIVKAKTTVTATTNSVTVGGVVTEQINGVTIGTVASGGTNNQVITDSAAAPVGTEANPSVIGDATVTVNGDSLGATGSVVAEGSVDLVVNLDGSPSGSWDGDSWEVTSAVCADATVNVNGVFMENIPSGDTENIEVRQETGATLVGSKQGQYWRVDDATVENSDASYSATVAAEGSLVLPDTPIKANGDLVINQPSTISKDLVVRYDTLGTVATTISGGEIVVPDSLPTPTPTITNSLSFDGVNDYATATPLIQQDSDFSITFWFKLNSLTGSQGFIGIYNELNTNRDGLNLYYDSNYIKYLSNNSWGEVAQIPWTGDLNWHHFTFTYSASTGGQAIYIDGASLGVLPLQNIITRYFDKIAIGLVRAHARYGNVKLADLGLHDSILNQLTITSMQTIGVASGSEVQRWVMDRPIGTTEGFIVDIINKQRMILRNMTTGFGIVADAP